MSIETGSIGHTSGPSLSIGKSGGFGHGGPKADMGSRSSTMQSTRPLRVSSGTERSGGSFKPSSHSFLKDTVPFKASGSVHRDTAHISKPELPRPIIHIESKPTPVHHDTHHETSSYVPKPTIHTELKPAPVHHEVGREIFHLPKRTVHPKPIETNTRSYRNEHPLLDTKPVYTHTEHKTDVPQVPEIKKLDVTPLHETGLPIHQTPVTEVKKPLGTITTPILPDIKESPMVHTPVTPVEKSVVQDLPKQSEVRKPIEAMYAPPSTYRPATPEVRPLPSPIEKTTPQHELPNTILKQNQVRPRTEAQTIMALEQFITKQEQKPAILQKQEKRKAIYGFFHSVESTLWVRALSKKKETRDMLYSTKEVFQAIGYIPAMKERGLATKNEMRLLSPDSLTAQITGISHTQIFHAILDERGKTNIMLALRVKTLRISSGMNPKDAEAMLEQDVTDFFKTIPIEDVMKEEDDMIPEDEENANEEGVSDEGGDGPASEYEINAIEYDRERPVDILRRTMIKDAIKRVTVTRNDGERHVHGISILHAIPDASEEKIQSSIIRISKYYERDGSYTAIQEELARAGEMEPDEAAEFIDKLIDMYPAVKIAQQAHEAVSDFDFDRVLNQTPFQFK